MRACPQAAHVMQVALNAASPQRVIWRQPLLWIVAGLLSVVLYTSNLSPSALMWTPARYLIQFSRDDF